MRKPTHILHVRPRRLASAFCPNARGLLPQSGDVGGNGKGRGGKGRGGKGGGAPFSKAAPHTRAKSPAAVSSGCCGVRGDGGGAPRQKPAAAEANEFPIGQFVVSKWPCTMVDYPAKDQPNSYYKLAQWVEQDGGCHISLRSRNVLRRQNRGHQLTIKGPAAYDVYCYFLETSKAVLPQLDWTMVAHIHGDIEETEALER